MSDATSPDTNSLPAGWERTTLAEIAQINPLLDRCVINDLIEVNFVPMRAVKPEGGGLTDPEIRAFGVVKKGYTSFLSGDVIMAKITPCMENGKSTVVPDLPDAVCFGSTEFHVIRPENGVDRRLIAQFLLQHEVRRKAQRAMTGGVGQMRVPESFLETLRIPLPPSKEQSCIADAVDELLSDLDSGIGTLEQVRGKLSQYRASILRAAVEGTLTAGWREQQTNIEPASELLKRILAERRCRWEQEQLRKFKEKGKQPPENWKTKYKEPLSPETNGHSEIPSSWIRASFDQIGETQGGVQKSPTRKPIRHHFPYLRVANVHRGVLDLRELKRLELSNEEIDRLRLEPGDLLIVEGNGSRTEIGRCAMWRGEVEDCAHQNHIIRVRPLGGLIPAYANLFLNSPSGQSAIQLVASSTSGLYTLSVSKIEKLTLPLPPTDEQETIVEAVEDQLSVVGHLEADIEAMITSAQGLRQSILKHAFGGKLVPQDPNDEAASELLKRIVAERQEKAREAAALKNATAKANKSRQKSRAKSSKKKKQLAA